MDLLGLGIGAVEEREGNDLAPLLALAGLPLYLHLVPDRVGSNLAECRAAWPLWRQALLERHPRHRPRSADVQLVNALTWPVGMAHLAAALVLGRGLRGEVRLFGAGLPPVQTLHLGGAALVPAADPLAWAVRALHALALDLHPATGLAESLLLRVVADRMVQAISVLGHATGEPARAPAWSERFLTRWPVQGVTRLLPDGDLRRATCCFNDRNAGGTRCANCPATASRPPTSAS